MQEGIRTATDYRKALDDPQVDAVDICLPHNLHAPIAMKAAEAGKHVLCEKPIAASLEEADRMIEAAEQAGVVLMIAENVRFNPLFHKIRDLLQDGVIGQPALIQMTRECYLTRSFLEDRRWFLDDKAAAGGIMMSGGIHDFETMRMLIGEVESVQALRARQRFLEMEGDDTSVALVRFRDGTVGTLVESFVMKSLTTAAGPEVHTLRIDGDLGASRYRMAGRSACSASGRISSPEGRSPGTTSMFRRRIPLPWKSSTFSTPYRWGRNPSPAGKPSEGPWRSSWRPISLWNQGGSQ